MRIRSSKNQSQLCLYHYRLPRGFKCTFRSNLCAVCKSVVSSTDANMTSINKSKIISKTLPQKHQKQSKKSLDDQLPFEFSWDTSKKNVKGTAFKKRKGNDGLNRSAVEPHNNSNQQKGTSTVSKNLLHVKKDLITVDLTKSKIESNMQYAKGHIKRKHKKDKLNATLNKDSDTKLGPGNKIKHHQSTGVSLFNEKNKSLFLKTQTGKSVSEKVFTETGKQFQDLSLHEHVVSNLRKIDFTNLTTVQERAIPVVLSGKDVLIRSQTGSGKTLAYAVPIIEALRSITPKLDRKVGVQAIIVVPTRELALQTHELFNKINTFQWVVTGHLCGGENRKTEKERLRKGVHVLIATPGRILDHVLHTAAFNLNNVRCLVLDEADRLLDMGFRKDVMRLVEELRAKANSEYNPLEILKKSQNQKIIFEDSEEADVEKSESVIMPLKDINSKNRQTILLSATLTKGVSELADIAMANHIFVDASDKNTDASKADSLVIPDTVKQEFLVTYVKHRLFTLSALIIAQSKKNSKMFVFMASTQMVEYHYELFTQCLLKMPINRGKLMQGNVVLLDVDSDNEEEEEEIVLDIEIFKLHGNMDQKARKAVFTGFRTAKSGVLLCTDVAARGLDVPTADCIVQYTGPQTDEDYLHRVGRTGRAGQAGFAVIFLTPEEQDYVAHLAEHSVFLKQCRTDNLLDHLCEVMKEPDCEKAAEALQRHYETSISKNKALHTSACFAHSTWSRFYNSYPAKMRSIFNFKNVNLGHYATSFGLRETPSQISRVVRGQVEKMESPKLNSKLANHMDEDLKHPNKKTTKQKRSVSLITSEYASGLEPVKKKRKSEKEVE